MILLSVAALFFLPALLVGRRAGCHTLCWVAPFLIAGRAARNFLGWTALRLAGRPEACRHCGSCTAACPMSIEVQENLQAGGLESTDCILCASCVDACPSAALRLDFGRRGFPPAPGLPVRILAILLLLGLASPALRADSLLPLPPSLGGMGGPHFRLTWLAGQPSMLGGGPVYLILDRRLYLGLSGSYLEGNSDGPRPRRRTGRPRPRRRDRPAWAWRAPGPRSSAWCAAGSPASTAAPRVSS